MFDNIGEKIKMLAKVLCWIGIVTSFVIACILWSQHDQYDYATRTYSDTIGIGIAVLFGGCAGSWIGSFFVYGFGELITETMITRIIHTQILKELQKQSVSDEKTKAETVRRQTPVVKPIQTNKHAEETVAHPEEAFVATGKSHEVAIEDEMDYVDKAWAESPDDKRGTWTCMTCGKQITRGILFCPNCEKE